MASRNFILAIGRAEVCTRPSYSFDLQMTLPQDLLLLYAAFVIEYRESYLYACGPAKKGAYQEPFRAWSIRTGNKLHPEVVRLGIGLLANQLLIPSQLFPLPSFLLCLIRSAPPSTNHPSAEPTQMTEMIDFSLAYGNLPPRQ